MNSLTQKISFSLLAALLIYLAFFSILNTQVFTKAIIFIAFHRADKSVEVLDISFRDHILDIPDFLQLSDFSISIRDKDKITWDLTANEASIECRNCLDEDKRQLDIRVVDMQIKNNEEIYVGHLDLQLVLDLKGKAIWKTNGDIRIKYIEDSGLEIKNFKALIAGYKNEVVVKDVWAELAKGIIKGEIFLEYAKNLPYSISMQFVDIDADEIGNDGRPLKEHVRGLFDGFVEVSGNAKRIKRFNGRIYAPSQSRVHSRLIGFLMGYLPKEAITEQFKAIVKSDDFVNLDEFDVTFVNSSATSIFTKIHMLSRENSFDLNPDIDIRLGTNIINLKSLLKGD